MSLWSEWWSCVRQLRGACSRQATFLWLALVLAALTIRSDRAGVTSLVRALALPARHYRGLLHLFHSSALDLERLTTHWLQLVLRRFTPLRVGPYLVCLADGLKPPQEGRKMPAVRSLHQAAGNNSKPAFIMGHSLQALSLLVRNPAGRVTAIPLIARIHEGLVFSNRDRRTLLDKLVLMFLGLARDIPAPVIVVADAYYASAKVIRPLLDAGHQRVTRARVNAVAYWPAQRPSNPRRGRPRLYGDKIALRQLAQEHADFVTAPSPVYGETGVQLAYRCVDLLWRPVGHLVRFVIVRHPQRGVIFLLATDTTLDPLDIITLYAYRFKIEVGFKQAVHTVGSYGYHCWMMDLQPIRRRTGSQHLHHRSDDYRRLVRRKLLAYHRFVQLGCIAQGLLQYLALHHGPTVWRRCNSWLRTMDPLQPPSELVVALALRATWPAFLARSGAQHELTKFLARLSGRIKRAAGHASA